MDPEGRTVRARLTAPFRGPRFALALFVAAVPLFAATGLIRVGLHQADGFDLGIFTQVVRRYAQFQAPLVTFKGDSFNIWGDHFHPIVALWVPLYWLWSSPGALIVGQSLVIAAAAFPLWSFIRRHARGPLSPRIITALVLFGWPVLTTACYDVHEIAFALPLLAWAVDALDRRANVELLISCGLLLLVREDMGVVVAAIGLVSLVWPRNGRRAWRTRAIGAGLFVGGLAAAVIITRIVIPHFSADGYQYWAFTNFGHGLWGTVHGVITAPWKVVWLFFWPWLKTATWLLLLVPTGFWALRSPYALIGLPIMAERLLGTRQDMWVPGGHYDSVVWIVVSMAAVEAWGRLPEARRTALRARFMVVVGLIISVIFAIGEGLYVVATASDIGGRTAAVAQVPANTCVVASNGLAGNFIATNRVTVPNVSRQRQDFYIVDLRTQAASLGWLGKPFFHIGTGVRGTTGTAASLGWTGQRIYDIAISEGFQPVFTSGEVVVLQASDYTGPDPVRCGPDAP